ncbi:MAG: hypothetical protein ACI9FJ_002559, partial [Alteromonadaceae bacterium]
QYMGLSCGAVEAKQRNRAVRANWSKGGASFEMAAPFITALRLFLR